MAKITSVFDAAGAAYCRAIAPAWNVIKGAIKPIIYPLARPFQRRYLLRCAQRCEQDARIIRSLFPRDADEFETAAARYRREAAAL
jgi:hypothetical protein